MKRKDPEVTYQNKDINNMDNVTQMEYQTIKEINIDRVAHNLRPLRNTIRLRQLARKRDQQLVDKDYLSHYNSKGQIYYEQDAKNMHINLGAYSGENIASVD